MFVVVHDYFMANDHGFHELIEMGVGLKLLHVFLNELPFVYLLADGNLLEDHLIGCECAGFIGQDVLNYS